MGSSHTQKTAKKQKNKTKDGEDSGWELGRFLQWGVSEELLGRVHSNARVRVRRSWLCHRLWQADVRCGVGPAGAGGRGRRPRLRSLRWSFHRSQHLRRTPQPRRHSGSRRRRQHHHHHRFLLLGRPVSRLHRRLPPPPVRHQRQEHTDPRSGGRFGSGGGNSDGDSGDLCSGLHSLRHRCRPEEGFFGNHRAHRHRFHRRSQHPGRRTLQRRLHEPSQVVRAGGRSRRLLPDMDILGGPTRRRCSRRSHIRRRLHRLIHCRSHRRVLPLKSISRVSELPLLVCVA